MTQEVSEYVLDSNVLIGHPEVLAKADKKARFVVPDFVLDELAVTGGAATESALSQIIQQAIDRRLLTVVPVDRQQFAGAYRQQPISKGYDVWLLVWFMQYAKGRTDVVLVTSDRDLLVLRKQGFTVLLPSELIERIQPNPTLSDEILERTRRLIRLEIVKSLGKIAIGAAVGVLGSLGYPWIITHLVYLGFVIGAVAVLVIGAVLFWVRGRYPLVYGATEVIVGIAAAINAFARADLNKPFDLTIVIQIFGGIYIIVRGLDNASKGMKGSILEARWNRIFRIVLPDEGQPEGRHISLSHRPPSAGTAPTMTNSG